MRPMTSISSLSDMHDDICTTTERKSAAIIILPFYKHQRLDGSLETTRADFRWVNRRVLQHALCSVGILVDHGLGGSTHISASNVCYSITVLFFGGCDDREALAYGIRMSEDPRIKMAIIRFSVEPEHLGEIVSIDADSHADKAVSKDEEFLANFKEKILEDSSITYEEKTVKNGSESIDMIHSYACCNLFLVGRMPDGEVALALNGRSECPELGPVGSLLISPEFSTTSSVLVVQQYQEKLSQNLTLETLDESPIGT